MSWHARSSASTIAARAGAVLVTGDKLLLDNAPEGASVLLPKDFLGIANS
jgi:hypothetical protein